MAYKIQSLGACLRRLNPWSQCCQTERVRRAVNTHEHHRLGDACMTSSGILQSATHNGGGVTGQTDAVRLGLARALVKYDEELRGQLREGKHLSRDPRVKERKKPGLKRARKAPTYTKRQVVRGACCVKERVFSCNTNHI